MPNTRDDEQRVRLARSILSSCAIKHGGIDALSRYLGVEHDKLLGWMGGKSVPPVEIVRKAIEPFIKES